MITELNAPIRTALSGDHVRTEYGSFSEFLAFLPEASKLNAGKGYYSQRTNKGSWFGTDTFGEALTLAHEGWAMGRTEADKFRAHLEAITGSMAIKQEIHYDVAGSYVDVGRYLEGEPECMADFHEEIRSQAGKIVTIAIDCFFSACISHDAIIRRGAATVALIDALENAGRSCELLLVYALGGRSGLHETIVPLKKAGEHLDIDRIAFMLAHPSTFRRLMFASGELEPDRDVRARYGYEPESSFYGSPSKPKIEADITVPQIGGLDERALLAWIFGELKKQGVEVAEATK